jgi:hypothetical protein
MEFAWFVGGGKWEMGNDFFVGQMKLVRTERDPQKQALKSNSCLHQR